VLFHAVIPPQLRAGERLRLGHGGLGVVIHRATTVGDDVYLHHGVTLATDVTDFDPRRMVIGSRVTIGTGACVLGPVRIGNDVAIGAGAVVTCDLPDEAVAVGVPARVVSFNGARAQKGLNIATPDPLSGARRSAGSRRGLRRAISRLAGV
jgi:serine O-acetyltransferase